ncbi:hypothetical protein [Cognatiluteimonas telluris]|jgi:hypothetical protein|uniref:hypothetical protein n=1 Tax=Cognatiluteimonas telluris TaxID=1104775 RepID=UPI0014080B4C|nr:hypothetical protein [Lysobacter telluris]
MAPLGGGLLLLGAAVASEGHRQVPGLARGLLYGVAIGLLLFATLRGLRDGACDGVTPTARRRYLRELVPAMAAYVIAVLLSVWLLKRVDAPLLRALVALLPVPAIALAMRAVVRRIRDSDELQRRIELEAVSVSAVCVSMGYLAAGLLQRARVIDIDASAAMIWVFPLLGLGIGIAKLVLRRRYD